ncbi:MAG: thioesterase [Candidatus Aminicenantes bacterium]|nr:thioesterase [Candidatus Aminicenantes bacterium]NIM81702.1 thioesterase [Candidatus Aminicenantes bacterium]NIN21073.1 thioesterase [Candidatus Aminicenantes bacterium]NIN44895.1 thioesterase [Candidatus Aminicenantes bacterium]NIN87709.1 thioesterase [Candidatus Aminicenantes bacterium]
MKKIKLFCFPYAGGAAAAFNKWRQYLDKYIDLRAVELAGRGKRIYDPPYNSIEEAVDDVFNLISEELAKGPYAFYGHSMGGIIAYELAYKIRDNNLPEPLHIFFSGRGAPNIPCEDDEMYHLLPEDEFREKIIELGGTPKEFFDHLELLEVLLPMLRSDFKIAETYEHNGEIKPLDYDITVFIGKEEEVNAEQMHGWREHTNKVCTIYYFAGEHFFIHDETEQIVRIINNTLLHAYKEHKE